MIIGTGYEFEYLNQVQYNSRSAPNPNYEKTVNSTLIYFLNYGLTENLAIEALLPWRKVVNNKFTYNSRQFIRMSHGYGDAIIMGKYRFAFLEDFAAVTIGAGLKLANGKLEEPDETGNRISDNLQIGSGTIDPVLSLYGSHTSTNLKLLTWLNIIARISTDENIYGYKYGNEIQTSMGMNYDLSDKLFLSSSIELIYTLRDTDQYGYRVKRERGGKWLYWTPGVSLRIRRDFVLDFQYPIAIYQYVNESQLISNGFLRMSLSYDWRMTK